MSDNDGYHNLSGAMEGSLSVGSLRVLLILLTPLGLNPSNSRNLKPRLSRVEGRLLGGLCLPRRQGQEKVPDDSCLLLMVLFNLSAGPR